MICFVVAILAQPAPLWQQPYVRALPPMSKALIVCRMNWYRPKGSPETDLMLMGDRAEMAWAEMLDDRQPASAREYLDCLVAYRKRENEGGNLRKELLSIPTQLDWIEGRGMFQRTLFQSADPLVVERLWTTRQEREAVGEAILAAAKHFHERAPKVADKYIALWAAEAVFVAKLPKALKIKLAPHCGLGRDRPPRWTHLRNNIGTSPAILVSAIGRKLLEFDAIQVLATKAALEELKEDFDRAWKWYDAEATPFDNDEYGKKEMAAEKKFEQTMSDLLRPPQRQRLAEIRWQVGLMTLAYTNGREIGLNNDDYSHARAIVHKEFHLGPLLAIEGGRTARAAEVWRKEQDALLAGFPPAAQKAIAAKQGVQLDMETWKKLVAEMVTPAKLEDIRID